MDNNSSHSDDRNGGYEISKMGASWFVSYAYHVYIDPTHANWENVKSSSSRTTMFRKITHAHTYWLKRVLEMNENKLNTSKTGLEGARIKEMARQILASMRTQG
jgi:hypothetical protein